MNHVLKRLARALFGDYAAYHILTRARGAASIPAARLPDDLACGPVQLTQLESCVDPAIRDQAFYFGDGARAWACMDRGGRIMGLCIYWYGDRYRERNFWPLRADEAKMVEVITLPEMRGRGVAPALIAQSCESMFAHGFQRVYARVWHSNEPSLRAFSKAGWVRAATIVEVFPLGRWRWRMVFRPAKVTGG